jgi:hypothetical protein
METACCSCPVILTVAILPALAGLVVYLRGRGKKYRLIKAVVAAGIVLLAIAISICIFVQLLDSPVGMGILSSEPPPATFQESDLVGVWQAEYSRQRIDRLTIAGDGTFQQRCTQGGNGDVVSVASSGEWLVEYRSDGGIYLHLHGARSCLYPEYQDPERWRPYRFCDPFSDTWLEMNNELVLNVRYYHEEITLVHMGYNLDGGCGGFDPWGIQPVFLRTAGPSSPGVSSP